MLKKKWIILLSVLVAIGVGAGLFLLPKGAPDHSIKIPGSYELKDGADNGFNYYHMEGVGSDGQAFYRPTFCTHKNFNNAAGSYIYYYNDLPGETAASNPEYYTEVLNCGTTEFRNGLEMTPEQYRHLRYCIVYTNLNRDGAGQYIYWTYLAKVMPHRYSNVGKLGEDEGYTWQDSYISYFGAKASNDFMGLGQIEEGDTIGIGDSCSVAIKYNGGDITAAVLGGQTSYPATLENDQLLVGPFVLEWAADSNPVLAQLNSGFDRNTAPLFAVKTTDSADSSRVRFFSANDLETPVVSVALGEEFYIAYRNTTTNMQAASGGISIPITVKSLREIATRVKADEFFIHPNAENQINVDCETARPQFQFAVRYKSTAVPQEQTDPDKDYLRPTVSKEVTEDNHINADGEYVDVLVTQVGTDVMHQMTVKSDDPKGTILTFQNEDYDLPLGRDDVAYVTNAAEFKAAITANKNIKLMADITLPSSWTPSNTVYNKIFDGNGCLLRGDGGTMTAPVFGSAVDAVFYRVQLVGFKMERTISAANTSYSTSSYYGGALVDYFGKSDGGRSKLLNCYVQGSLHFDIRITDSHSHSSAYLVTAHNSDSLKAYVGFVAGNVTANEVYGIKALPNDFGAITNANPTSIDLFCVRQGGLFGIVNTSVLENCSLLEGSALLCNVGYVGGIAAAVVMSGEGAIRNCSLNYSLDSNAYSAGTYAFAPYYFGGLSASMQGCKEIDRCFVNCNYQLPNTVKLYFFGGLVASLIQTNALSITNCAVEFPSSNYIYCDYTQYKDTLAATGGTAAGIVNFRNASSVTATTTISRCAANVKLNTSIAAAGVFTSDVDSRDITRTVNVNDCYTAGSIVSPVGAGIGCEAGKRHVAASGTHATTHGTIQNCISVMNISSGTVAGVWADKGNGGSSNSITIGGCYFAGSLSGTSQKLIFNAPSGTASGSYNYRSASGSGAHSSADGQNVTLSPSTAMGFFTKANHTVTYYVDYDISVDDSKTWKLPAGSSVPVLSPWVLRTRPVQRIYVNDYYHRDTQQLDISNFYVFEDGAFKPIWQSQYAVSGSNSASTDIDMRLITDSDEFVFYYKKPSIQAGAWQNTVKIIPKEDLPVGGGTDTRLDPSFPRETDDDWVLSQETAARLNIVKMTAAYNYPMPLEDCTFRLYRSDKIYSDFTDIAYSSWQHEDVTPSGYLGAGFNTLFSPGSYVLKETAAPNGYGTQENLGRTWYIIFRAGEMRIYLDNPSMDDESARLELGELSSDEEGVTIYSVIIKNLPDEDMPRARVRVVKWNEDFTQRIDGEHSTTDNNLPYYTGAVYSLIRFAGDDFTGEGYGYGNMLLAGDPAEGYCDIEYGYYWLVERQAPVGYAVDPTPIYIKYTPQGGLEFFKDGHTAGSDQIDYLDGVQDMTVTWSKSSGDGIEQLLINTKDKKPEYRLTIEKYRKNKPSSTISGLDFELYSSPAGELIGTYTTAANGRVTIDFPTQDGHYVLKEVDTGAYRPIPDYQIETRGGALFISGGPYHYQNIKLIHGVSDNKTYVILDADGFANPVLPGDDNYPKDFYPVEEGKTAVIHMGIRVPNEPTDGEPSEQAVKIVKESWDTNDPKTGQISARFGLYSSSDTAETTPLYVIEANAAPIQIETGVYRVAELQTEDGYILPTERWTLTVTDSAVTISGGPQYSYELGRYSTAVSISQQEDGTWQIVVPNRTPLETAEPFRLIKEDEEDPGKNNLQASFEIHDNSGVLLYTVSTPSEQVFCLLPGVYTLNETVFPSGYEHTEYSYIIFVMGGGNTMVYGGDGVHNPYISRDGEISLVHISNHRIEQPQAGIDFSFTKTDLEGKPLAGVSFELYACTDKSDGHSHSPLAQDKPDCCWDVANPLQTVTTADDGLVSFTGLEPGDYMLAETKTLPGLQLPSGQWLITIGEDSAVTITARGEEKPPAFRVEQDSGVTEYFLPNFPQITLPASGGGGALILSAAGGILLAAAGITALLWRRKRRIL
ncbi:MAG: prealbumin-like fold domain-containing protein [Clostridium sp.]|nr:prealbumin-like fold domain-containing protein [Clostridium sp.]